jgi:general stress protein 26
MDSINRQQAEPNRQDLSGTDAVAKIQEMVKQNKTCFFCTAVTGSQAEGARPMSVLQVDDHGHLWFLSASDSHKNREVALDPAVTLYFQVSTHAGFVRISGRAMISSDRAKIKELWQPLFSTWFTEGINDPRITVIQFIPTEGYYWDTKHGTFIAGVKMLIGAAIGKTLDDSIEGKLRF